MPGLARVSAPAGHERRHTRAASDLLTGKPLAGCARSWFKRLSAPGISEWSANHLLPEHSELTLLVARSHASRRFKFPGALTTAKRMARRELAKPHHAGRSRRATLRVPLKSASETKSADGL